MKKGSTEWYQHMAKELATTTQQVHRSRLSMTTEGRFMLRFKDDIECSMWSGDIYTFDVSTNITSTPDYRVSIFGGCMIVIDINKSKENFKRRMRDPRILNRIYPCIQTHQQIIDDIMKERDKKISTLFQFYSPANVFRDQYPLTPDECFQP